jgi:hypothetical protein
LFAVIHQELNMKRLSAAGILGATILSALIGCNTSFALDKDAQAAKDASKANAEAAKAQKDQAKANGQASEGHVLRAGRAAKKAEKAQEKAAKDAAKAAADSQQAGH